MKDMERLAIKKSLINSVESADKWVQVSLVGLALEKDDPKTIEIRKAIVSALKNDKEFIEADIKKLFDEIDMIIKKLEK